MIREYVSNIIQLLFGISKKFQNVKFWILFVEVEYEQCLDVGNLKIFAILTLA